jgi:hypothetical protein
MGFEFAETMAGTIEWDAEPGGASVKEVQEVFVARYGNECRRRDVDDDDGSESNGEL